MKVTVKLKYLRIAPRKARLVADLVRGKPVIAADDLLEFTRKKATKPIKKLLQSAVAAAEHNFQLKKSNLFVSKIAVDEGPSLKRSRFAGRGRILPITKRTSHITLVLDEIKPTEKVKKPRKTKAKAEKPEKKQKVIKEVKEKREELKRGKKPEERVKSLKPRFGKVARKMFRRKAF